MKLYLSILLIIFPYALQAQVKQFNRDSSKSISLTEFNKQVNDCIVLLQTKKLKDISDQQHIQIMMCLNTIFIGRFNGGVYAKLEKIKEKANYEREITKVYKEWIPNRGMGFYFPKLQMELYGTPRMYAVYHVIGR
jgi:hypothetical protein